MSEPLLSVRDLTVEFQRGERPPLRAVDAVSLDLAAGEVVALVGESGSGKSATALALLGLHDPETAVGGSVRYGGEELVGAPEARLRALRGAELALVAQNSLSALNPVIRVGDQIAEQLRAHAAVGRREAAAAAVRLLERAEVPDAARRARAYPHELSGGLRQRAAIAMALACGPKVLIADEPTTALDTTVQARIVALLGELREREGLGVLLVTHDLGLVGELADRIVVLDGGQVVEQGPAERVLARPSAPKTRELLAAVPRLRRRRGGAPAPPPGAAPLLELDQLRVSFTGRAPWRRGRVRTRAVDGVSLTVAAGETVGLVGESGSGKSTLARAATRLIDIDGGRVVFDGRDVTGLGRRALTGLRAQLQIVFQDPYGSLNPRRRVGDSVALPLRLHGHTPAAARRRVGELLERVGLAAADADRWPHEFSGGERQRIGIARALALEPRLIVLDEPLSALDVTVQARILELLAALQRDLGLAYLLISHDLAVVGEVADRVAVMRAGRLVEVGPTTEVFARPSDPYTAELLAAAPRPSRDPASLAGD